MNVTNAKRNHFELNVFSYKDVENLDLPTQQVLLSNLWRTEENVMIYSKTGVGKSWLSLSIAACIQFFHFPRFLLVFLLISNII